MKRILQLLCIATVLPLGALMAQPVNDNCSGAVEIAFGADEASATRVAGDTRGATGVTDVPNVCSGTWFRDDVWFFVTLPNPIPDADVVFRCYFDNGADPDNVPAVGMAIYSECSGTAEPIYCFSSSDPAVDDIVAASKCLEPGLTYYVRVWSGGDSTSTSGTFDIAVFADTGGDNVLWSETWANGIEGAGWTTFGTCANPDSNENAVWVWTPDGVYDQGAFANVGVGVIAASVCDGAVGVDSDFNDNGGDPGNQGGGSCVEGEYFLVSPAIYTGDWGVAGVSIAWTQGIREYQSRHFVSYRTNTTGGMWSEWRDFEVNTEYPINSAHFAADPVRLFLGGATDGDSLQIRFIYQGNYYYWGIDDIKLVETEAHNLRSQSNWYAIAPAVRVPYTESRMWYGMNDVYNAGAVPQTNVNLNLSIYDSQMNTVYDDNLSYGTLPADSLAENVNFMTPVVIPTDKMDTYTGMYTVTSDSATMDNDFDFSDNQNSFTFSTTMGEYALETGFTRSLAVNDAIYDDGAPLSFTHGNFMHFPNGSMYKATSITWGVSNPDEVAATGVPLNIILFEWNDLNQNQIAEASERIILGVGTVQLEGDEGDNYITETVLEPFNDPSDLELKDGGNYFAMVEYNAVDRTFFFLLASEEYDYGASVFSAEQAGMPYYASVLGFSPDGNIQGIDYEVTELDVNDDRIYFGWDIVPLVRLNVEKKTSVEDVLSADNKIQLFPNPADEKLTVQFDLQDVADELTIEVVDATGRILENRRLGGVLNETYELNVSNYAAGAYFLKVQTEAGSRSMRFVVQH